ncbi:MAG: sugar phosphate isomerase/epimerase [Fimbriimonadia bacterium]|jgi:sugar phosphate isomerase/epimerase
MVAISTALNARHRGSAREVFEELKALGYEQFEVNVHFSEEMVEETERMVRAGEIEIVSVHNYCPVPPGIERTRSGGDLFHFSAEEAEVRGQALKWTLRSIETAARLGARFLVGHWGIVPVEDGKEVQHAALERLRRGEPGVPEMVREAVERRQAMARPYVERALDTFSQLLPTAREHGVRLGVECRNYFHEIPSLEEVGEFLALDPAVIGYWHDIGHAEILEFLGVVPERSFAARWADRAIAVHVHDVKQGADHRPMGEGDIDFRAELSPFPASAPWVIEVHSGDAMTMRRMGEELRRIWSEIHNA